MEFTAYIVAVGSEVVDVVTNEQASLESMADYVRQGRHARRFVLTGKAAERAICDWGHNWQLETGIDVDASGAIVRTVSRVG